MDGQKKRKSGAEGEIINKNEKGTCHRHIQLNAVKISNKFASKRPGQSKHQLKKTNTHSVAR